MEPTDGRYNGLVLALFMIVIRCKEKLDFIDWEEAVIFKPSTNAGIQDWITPSHVEVVKVETHAAQLDRIQQRAKELREAMGARYLCHENNRVRRLDEQKYRPRSVLSANATVINRAA